MSFFTDVSTINLPSTYGLCLCSNTKEKIKANKKFTKRWKKLEKIAKEEKLDLKKLSLKKYDVLWNKAKK